MKYLIVMGSPRRKGNTNTLALEMQRQITEQGDTCDILNVYSNEIKGCRHCEYCQTNKGCCIKDPITETLNYMECYDVLIIASPLYFFYFTAPVKAFLDRLYSVNKNNLKLGAIVVSGSEFFDGGSDLAIETLRRSCHYCGMTWVGAVQKTSCDHKQPLTHEDKYNIGCLIDNAKSTYQVPYSVFISN